MSLLDIVAAGLAFTCTPTQVWDGDGPIWCAEGPRIRLAGVAAREIDNTCKRGHPCPRASGIQARDGLVSLLGGPQGLARTGHILVRARPLRCVSIGNGKGTRTAAWCRSERLGDLSCAMIARGLVVRWDRYWRGHQC
ncbi:hypothetical protein [uncultured Sphingomonas sp.]|uniref:hypothetical protein n=1 Tax=uncultured Sphingomonas sp. TaxID=158754 RepID=UPI00374897FE